MNNWKKTKLGEVCEYESQKTSDLDISTYISTENMLPDKGGITLASTLPTKGTFTKYSNGQTLVSNIRPYFKKIWRADKNGACSNDVLCFILKDKIIDSFFYYLLNQDTFFEFVMNGAKGTKMPRGDRKHILQFEINLPPLDEQKRIADVLSALDNKIEINNKINENLEAQAQAIFKQWFVDFEFPDEEGKPYKSNGGKFIDSELGKIPEGWKVGTLGEFIRFVKGKKPKNIVEEKLEGYELYLTIDALTSSNSTYSETEKNVLVNELDLLMVMDGASSGTMHFGKKGIVGSTLSKIELIDNKYKEIIYRCLKYYETDIKNHTTGSAIPHTDKNYVLQLPFIYPHKIMQCCNFFINIREQQIINQKENHRLSEIRDGLLPRLMNGEVRV